MNVTLINPSMSQGGTQRVISELANQWAFDGYDVTLILFMGSDIFYELDPRINVIDLGFSYSSVVDKFTNEFLMLFKLRRILKKSKSKFILSFVTQFNIIVILSCMFTKLRVFVSDRTTPMKKLPFIHGLLRKFVYRYCAGFIAQTSLAKELIEKEIPSINAKVIPNPVKSIKLDKSIKKENIILNVGRLTSTKGQKFLIEALANINNKDWKAVFVGSGPDYDYLRSYAIELNVQEQVQFEGACNNIDEILQRSRIFAFPSLTEGFPNALAEALSAGLACVSFDCETGPSDLINDGFNGYLVPVNRVDLFTERLNKLINDQDLVDLFSRNAIDTGIILERAHIANKYLSFCLNSK
jgi:GalNAc-alpha-(1->4)-GalNAc-alpha-(1->3)-diNAcBac-PP-undecaprenol alpha-1,4-N-acetyl-D-galactosaminyltransferase